MIEFKREGILLEKTTLAFEQKGVLNPAVIVFNGTIHMLYRAMAENGYSSIGYCRLDHPLKVGFRSNLPLLKGETPAESMGMEDPRLVCLNGLFLLSYTAFDGFSALGSLLLSYDLQHFFGKRIVVALNRKTVKGQPGLSAYEWDKNLVFFPRKINGKIYFMHRIKPSILLSSAEALNAINQDYWSQEQFNNINTPLELNANVSGSEYEGAACPPIETVIGWLLIYHAAYRYHKKIHYKVHVALLDLDNPNKVLAELPYPVLEPKTNYERNGNVDNVVFPTASITVGDTLFIYYGAADTCIACATISIADLLFELLKFPIPLQHEA